MGRNEYLLDTNILIEFLRGNKNVINNILKAKFENCHISVVSLYELYYGAYNAGSQSDVQKEINRVNALREEFDILPLPEKADYYGKIKVYLRKIGRPVDEFDMIIGGHALTEGLTIVTDNVKHFKDMNGIKIVNWT